MLLKEWFYTRLHLRRTMLLIVTFAWGATIAHVIHPDKASQAGENMNIVLVLTMSTVAFTLATSRMQFEKLPGPGLLLLKADGGNVRMAAAKWIFELPATLIALSLPLAYAMHRNILSLHEAGIVCLLTLTLISFGFAVTAATKDSFVSPIVVLASVGAPFFLWPFHSDLVTLQAACWIPLFGIYAQTTLITSGHEVYAPALWLQMVEGMVLCYLSSFGLRRMLSRQLR